MKIRNEVHMGDSVEFIEWKRASIESLRRESFVGSKIRNVTVVAYYFREIEDFDSSFWLWDS